MAEKNSLTADDPTSSPDEPAPKALPPPAQRALDEARARRLALEGRIAAMPPERGGRGGQEPVRYGDWEVKGLATDF